MIINQIFIKNHFYSLSRPFLLKLELFKSSVFCFPDTFCNLFSDTFKSFLWWWEDFLLFSLSLFMFFMSFIMPTWLLELLLLLLLLFTWNLFVNGCLNFLYNILDFLEFTLYGLPLLIKSMSMLIFFDSFIFLFLRLRFCKRLDLDL